MKHAIVYLLVATSLGVGVVVGCTTEEGALGRTDEDAGVDGGLVSGDPSADAHRDVDAHAGDGGQPEASTDGCTIPRVEHPDDNGSGGPPGCVLAADCTVRYVGDY